MSGTREQFEGHFFDALDFPEGALVPMVIESIAEAGSEKDAKGKVIDLPIFSFRGHTKRFIVGKTSWKNCKAIFDTPDESKWIGGTVNLQRRYLKAAQGFGQENCLCIRVVPPVGMPILKSAANFMGSATPYGDVPRPSQPISPEDQAAIDDAKRNIAEAADLDALEYTGTQLADKPQAVKDAVKADYRKRKAELEQGGDE